MRLSISLALIQSMPVPDEKDGGPGNGNGIMEIPKFIIIATSKFHFLRAGSLRDDVKEVSVC